MNTNGCKDCARLVKLFGSDEFSCNFCLNDDGIMGMVLKAYYIQNDCTKKTDSITIKK